MTWDDLYRLDIDTLRHEYVDLAEQNEQLINENEELLRAIEFYENADLKQTLAQRDNEINALKHMLDRLEE